jgi:hypothetical protein
MGNYCGICGDKKTDSFSCRCFKAVESIEALNPEYVPGQDLKYCFRCGADFTDLENICKDCIDSKIMTSDNW